jgi:hypothetical protein
MGYGARGVAASLWGSRAAEGRKNFAEQASQLCKLLQTVWDYAASLIHRRYFAKLQSPDCKLQGAM